jgi:hypothetical protein
MYLINSFGQPKKSGRQAWGFGVVLTNPHRKNILVTKCHKEPRIWMDSLDKGLKEMKSDMRFGKWNTRPYTASPHTRGIFSILMFYLRPCRSSAVRRWLSTAAARVRVRVPCEFCGGQSGTGAGFLRVLRFPLPIIPRFLHYHNHPGLTQ